MNVYYHALKASNGYHRRTYYLPDTRRGEASAIKIFHGDFDGGKSPMALINHKGKVIARTKPQKARV